MGTEKQNEANRQNAQRSTGPRTNEGKRTSSLNALKHGLFARIHILPSESVEDFQNLEASLRDELKPQSLLQEIYFSKIVEILWRMRRVEMIEAGLFKGLIDSAQYEILLAMARGDNRTLATTPLIETQTMAEGSPNGHATAYAPSSTHEQVLFELSKISFESREMAMVVGKQIGRESGEGIDRLSKYERHLISMLNSLINSFENCRSD
ncbi:MAG: hypothetical protein KF799_10030 [Bdellovibrionales bacterium]|nr:hypothetical protein [Bdellovibrionales bacterium]